MELVMWWLRMVLKLQFFSESRPKKVSFGEVKGYKQAAAILIFFFFFFPAGTFLFEKIKKKRWITQEENNF